MTDRPDNNKPPEKPTGKLNIQHLPIADLLPADYNPRKMSDSARQGLSNSIDTFGYVESIIWNKQTGNIVGGHQRLNDLITKGIQSVDVSVVDIPMIKEKALNIALNNQAISGEYDEFKLQDLLDELQQDNEALFKELRFDEIELPDVTDFKDEFKLDLSKKSNLIQVTIALTEEQNEMFNDAKEKARTLGPYIDTENENDAGNALQRISETFIRMG